MVMVSEWMAMVREKKRRQGKKKSIIVVLYSEG